MRDYRGLPKLAALRRLREPGEFSRFSRPRYRQLVPRTPAVLATEPSNPAAR